MMKTVIVNSARLVTKRTAYGAVLRPVPAHRLRLYPAAPAGSGASELYKLFGLETTTLVVPDAHFAAYSSWVVPLTHLKQFESAPSEDEVRAASRERVDFDIRQVYFRNYQPMLQPSFAEGYQILGIKMLTMEVPPYGQYAVPACAPLAAFRQIQANRGQLDKATLVYADLKHFFLPAFYPYHPGTLACELAAAVGHDYLRQSTQGIVSWVLIDQAAKTAPTQ
jgi:hypothetical protein